MLEHKAQRRKLSPRKEMREIARLRRGFERNLESRLGRYFISIANNSAEQVEQSGAINLPVEIIQKDLSQILLPFYRDVMQKFGERVLMNLGLKGEFEDMVRGYMLSVGGSRITQMSTATQRQLSSIVLKGFESGESNVKIANALRERGQVMSKGRAATIARTEVHSASTFATHQMSTRYMPQGTQKRWMATPDGRTRRHHAAMNGITIDMDEMFTVNVNGIPYELDYCGDPLGGVVNTINCRCQTIYIQPEDDVEEESVTSSGEPWIYREKIKGRTDLDEMNERLRTAFPSTDDLDMIPPWHDVGKKAGMTPDEFRAITGYTGSAYIPINQRLRNWFYEGPDAYNLADKELLVGFNETVASGLRKLPPYKGTSVRGIDVRDIADFVEKNGIKKGAIYRSESIFSTSRGGSVDPTFEGNVTFRIEGKNGRYVEEMSMNRGEDEVLFPAGHEFEITSVTREDDKLFIEMKDIGDDVKAESPDESVVKISNSMARKMQSELPLAAVDNVLLNLR